MACQEKVKLLDVHLDAAEAFMDALRILSARIGTIHQFARDSSR